MLTVILYGDLRKRFGRRYVLDVRSPAEAVHALCMQLRGLRQYFIEHATQKFLVRGHQDYTEDDICYPQSEGVLKIVPLVEGTGAVGRIIGGAALAIVGGVMMFYGVPMGAQVMALGVALAFSGVAQMLAPRPPSTGATPEKPDNTPNLAFDGAVNTMGQGGPVPLGYGRMIVGSQIVSVGFSTNNEIVVP
jgi:predicted phage tail protein